MSMQSNLSVKKIPTEIIQIVVIMVVGFISLIISVIFFILALKDLNADDPIPESTSVLNRLQIEQAINTIQEKTILEEITESTPVIEPEEQLNQSTESAAL